MRKHEAVAGAVHGLHSESLALDLPPEHVFFVGRVVAGGRPQIEIEDVGRTHFLVAPHSVLLADHLHELQIDLLALGVEER